MKKGSDGQGADIRGFDPEGLSNTAGFQPLPGDKEVIHVLESTLITWTKQIKNVLKQVKLAKLNTMAMLC